MPKKNGLENIRGSVVIKPLDSVKPNTWNPNKMTPDVRDSLKHGLEQDGWLISQTLLVWGKDKRGKAQNIIIDGEHRWSVATEIGFKNGPMVFLNGIAEAEAKALTIKLGRKRGEQQDDLLKPLLQDLSKVLELNDMPLDLGFSEDSLMKLLSTEAETVAGPSNPPPPPSLPAGLQSTSIKIVQLFLSGDDHSKFESAIRKLAEKHGTKNISDTVRETVFKAARV